MTKKVQDIDELVPEKLFSGFAKSRIGARIFLAFAIHVVVIGGTSVTFVWDNYVDPVGAARRREAEKALEKKKADEQRKAARAEKESPSAEPDKRAGKSSAGETTGAGTEHEQLMEKHRGTKIIKKITEMPKPGEIPMEPDDFLDLDETDFE